MAGSLNTSEKCGIEQHKQLIASAFDAVRFQPGRELIERYCREGRLVLCLDGLDDLSADVRSELLDDVVRFAEAAPRVRLVVLARNLEKGSMTGYKPALRNVESLFGSIVGLGSL